MNSLKLIPQVYDNDIETLVKRIAQGSQASFKLLFDKYQPTVFKVAMLYLKDTHQAEEIVQDVFFKIWINRENLTTVMSFESWLFILTKNHTLNHLKKQAREKANKDNWGIKAEFLEQSVESEYISSEYQKTLQQAISHLPAQQQITYKLAKEEGLSYEAIGLQLSISPLTVKTHMARALNSLRKFFKNQY